MNGRVLHYPSSRVFMVLMALWLLISFLLASLYLFSIPGFFRALGLDPRTALFLSLLSILGSTVNVPVHRVRRTVVVRHEVSTFWGITYPVPLKSTEEITVSVNLGGCVVPLAVSCYLLATRPHLWLEYAIDTAATTVVSYATARVVPGVGIAVPFFLPAAVAGATALMIADGQAASVAYVAGTLGTLIGADLLHLRRAVRWGNAAVLSIGGAGTFDAIFVTGLTAVWIAYALSPGG